MLTILNTLNLNYNFPRTVSLVKEVSLPNLGAFTVLQHNENDAHVWPFLGHFIYPKDRMPFYNRLRVWCHAVSKLVQ